MRHELKQQLRQERQKQNKKDWEQSYRDLHEAFCNLQKYQRKVYEEFLEASKYYAVSQLWLIGSVLLNIILIAVILF